MVAPIRHTYTYRVYLDESVDAPYVSECLEVGTASGGATPEEALANIKEATALYLEAGGELKPIRARR